MVKFCSLSSGSSGNCIFLGTDNTGILVDAGLSGAKTEEMLETFGESCRKTSAILITHEHNDHIHGAGILSRKYDIPIYATKGTWENMNIGKIKDYNIRIVEKDYGFFNIGDIQVSPFSVPHDAKEAVAYSFYAENHKISVATDIGHMTEEIENNIKGSDLLLLESNHDENMLRYGPYSMQLKKRIHGEFGHLSNDDAAKTAVKMARTGTKIFFLGHLSHENNTPVLAFNAVCRELSQNGFENGKNVSVYVARRDAATKVVTLN